MKKTKGVAGIIVPLEELEKGGFKLEGFKYRANAIFKGGIVLERVKVLEEFCFYLYDDGKSVLIFKPEEQEKPFKLEKLYEN
jgi:hypothetical protein